MRAAQTIGAALIVATVYAVLFGVSYFAWKGALGEPPSQFTLGIWTGIGALGTYEAAKREWAAA